jgi:hypothetical protein
MPLKSPVRMRKCSVSDQALTAWWTPAGPTTAGQGRKPRSGGAERASLYRMALVRHARTTRSECAGSVVGAGRFRSFVWWNQNQLGPSMISTDILTKSRNSPLDVSIGWRLRQNGLVRVCKTTPEGGRSKLGYVVKLLRPLSAKSRRSVAVRISEKCDNRK